jgi:hypothetical protein
MKIKKIFLFILVFIFILSFLLWSIPIWGAEKNIEEKNIIDIYQSENIFLSDTGFNLQILKPKILPDSKIFFLKILGEQLKKFFLFSKIKRLNYDIKLANFRIIETKELSLKKEIEEKLKLNSLERFVKKTKNINKRALDLINKKSSQIAQYNISDKLTSSFITWQKILSEISFLNEYYSEMSFSAKEIWERNNSQIPLLIIKYEGIEEFISILEKYFFNDFDNENNDISKENITFENNEDKVFKENNILNENILNENITSIRNDISNGNNSNKDISDENISDRKNIHIKNELFSNLRNLEVFNGIDFDIFSNEKIWILKDKLIGKAMAEIFSAYQIYGNDFGIVINSVPFLHNLTKKNIFLESEIRSGFEEIFSLISDSIEMNFSNQLAEDCYTNMLLKMESNSKKLENGILDISLTRSDNKRNILVIFSEQIKGYIVSAKEKRELNDIQSSCLLLKQSHIVYQISRIFSFYSDNEEKILEIVKNTEKEIEKKKEILENYQEYVRVSNIFNQLKSNSELVRDLSNRKDILRLLKQNILFWNWQRNLEIAKNIIDENKEKKYLFLKETDEKFNIWCWNERGIIFESLSLFPNCLLLNNERISLLEWIQIQK